jgi:hypothetical protein
VPQQKLQVQAIRTMLAQSNLTQFWDEALANYVATYNLTHTKQGKQATPDSIWFNISNLSFSHLHVFGEPCYPHVMPSHQVSKLDPRAYTGIFLGYDIS